MKPQWFAPPSTGSKLRDAPLVAEKLTEWGTKLAVLPFAGLGKELSAYDGAAKLIVADNDPAVRAYWRATNEGGLEAVGELTKFMWTFELSREVQAGGDCVQRAWKALCAYEGQNDTTYAAWAMAVFAGARNGGRRRNKKGEYNWPYAPKSNGVRDPNWLLSRIPSREKMQAADTWCKERVIGVLDDFTEAFRLAACEPNPRDSAYLIDPPYGHEKFHLYDGTWTTEKRNELVRLTHQVVAVGAKAIVWCDADDLEVFRPATDDFMTWTFRPAKTHMKSGGLRAGGEVEVNRSAAGGWMGVSR